MKILLSIPLLFLAAAVVADRPTDRGAWRKIYPQLAAAQDFTNNPDDSLADWKIKDKRFSPSTAAQIATVKTQIVGVLPPGGRVYIEGAFTHANIVHAEGRISDVKTFAATFIVPDSLTAAHAAMIALFPQ